MIAIGAPSSTAGNSSGFTSGWRFTCTGGSLGHCRRSKSSASAGTASTKHARQIAPGAMEDVTVEAGDVMGRQASALQAADAS